MLHFSSPHCRDVIEIRTAQGQQAVDCIRIKEGKQFQLFEVDGNRLQLVGLFGSLGEAKNWALRVWRKG